MELQDAVVAVTGGAHGIGRALCKPQGQASGSRPCTQEEIARVLQIPKGTVKSRLFHARKYLFEKLRPFLGGDT